MIISKDCTTCIYMSLQNMLLVKCSFLWALLMDANAKKDIQLGHNWYFYY